MGVGPVYQPGLADIYQKISGLRVFTTVTIDRNQDNFDWAAPHYDEPEEFSDGVPELQTIYQSGTVLTESLSNPETADMAIDSLLSLVAIQNSAPELTNEVCKPLIDFDQMDVASLDTVIGNADDDLTAKILRLVCMRKIDTRSDDPGMFEHYLPQIIGLKDKRPGSESRLLYDEFISTLSKVTPSSEFSSKRNFGAEALFTSYIQSIGYEFYRSIMGPWQTVKSELCDENWVRENLDVMTTLEAQEPGLCRKISDTFGIYTFANYTPEMLADMYKERIENPSLPYVMSIRARSDFNLAFRGPDRKAKMYRRLKKRGIRYEEHEVATLQDVDGITREAQELKRQHGALISDLVINAHGTPNSMELSRGHDGMINRRGAWCLSGFRDVMSESARGILLSCSVARQDIGAICIANTVSQYLGRESVGPTRNASSVLTLGRIRRSPRLNVRYGVNSNIVFTPAAIVLGELLLTYAPDTIAINTLRDTAILIGAATLGYAARGGPKRAFSPNQTSSPRHHNLMPLIRKRLKHIKTETSNIINGYRAD